MANKIYRCPLCSTFKTSNKQSLYDHIENIHSEEFKNSGLEYVSQYYFNLKYKKDHGNCIVCHKPTKWNESVERYDRLCSNRCAEIYKKKFRENMMKKYGKIHLLDDPDQQKKMLEHRKISGKYKWSDGTEKTYTGNYEEDFLEFLDKMMNFKSQDVLAPAPQVFKYKFDDKDHFYIPDFYIASLNLLVEIKDGGENPNLHHKIQDVDKRKEVLKDNVMNQQNQFNYLKITDKDYSIFIEYLIDIKTGKQKWIPPKDEKINFISEETILTQKLLENSFNELFEYFLYECGDELKQELLSEDTTNRIKKPIFIILSTPGIFSPVSSAIKKITHSDYSHSSISLDPNLDKCYSFTLENGFTEETKDKFRKLNYKICVLYTEVSNTAYKTIQKFINFISANRGNYRYNKDRIASLLIGKKENLTDEFVCSQFVSKCLSIGKVKLKKDFSLYTPVNFLSEPKLKFLCKADNIDEVILLKDKNPS